MRASSFDRAFWSFLSSPLSACFLGLAQRLLDRLDGLAAGFGEEDVRLPGILVRSLLVEKALRLQPVDGLGDGRRAHAEPARQLAGRLAVVLVERDHDLVLPGIEAMRQQPCGKCGPRQSGGRMQPAHCRALVVLGHLVPPFSAPGADWRHRPRSLSCRRTHTTRDDVAKTTLPARQIAIAEPNARRR